MDGVKKIKFENFSNNIAQQETLREKVLLAVENDNIEELKAINLDFNTSLKLELLYLEEDKLIENLSTGRLVASKSLCVTFLLPQNTQIRLALL